MDTLNYRNKTISLILRLSLAFSFLYPAINGFFEPYNWTGYFPSFLQDITTDTTLLLLFALFEITIALWLISGWKLVYASTITTLTLLAIVTFNFSEIDVLFRDIPIAMMGIALIILHKNKPAD